MDSISGGRRSGLSMGEMETETESKPLLEKWEVKMVVEEVVTKRVIGELVAEEGGVPVEMKDDLIVGHVQKQPQKEEEDPLKKVKQVMDSEVATNEKDVWVAELVGEAMVVVVLGLKEEAGKGEVMQWNLDFNQETAETGKDARRSSVIDHQRREQLAIASKPWGLETPAKRALRL